LHILWGFIHFYPLKKWIKLEVFSEMFETQEFELNIVHAFVNFGKWIDPFSKISPGDLLMLFDNAKERSS